MWACARCRGLRALAAARMAAMHARHRHLLRATRMQTGRTQRTPCRKMEEPPAGTHFSTLMVSARLRPREQRRQRRRRAAQEHIGAVVQSSSSQAGPRAGRRPLALVPHLQHQLLCAAHFKN